MWEQTKRTFLDALDRVIQGIARLLPSVLGMLILVLLSTLLALLVRALVRRVCTRLDVDRRLREWGVAAPVQAGRTPPSRIAERVAGWTIVVMGFVVGLNILESTATSELALRLLGYVPHVLVALVILVAGMAVSRAVERGILIGAVNMGLHSARLLALGARWLLLIVTGAMALEHLGIGGTILTTSFAIVFGGIVLALSLAFGLGSREFVARSLERRLSDPGEKQESPSPDHTHHL